MVHTPFLFKYKANASTQKRDTWLQNPSVLVRVSAVVKRHHDQGNSYKRPYLVGAGLQVQRFDPLSSQWKALQHPGRHYVGGAESSVYSSEGC